MRKPKRNIYLIGMMGTGKSTVARTLADHFHSDCLDTDKLVEQSAGMSVRDIFSQHGEDGILDFIFRRIGTTNQFLVEIGLEDGSECNSRYFLENGWNGILLDNFSYSTNISWSDPVSKSKRLEFKQKNFSIPKKISTFLQNEFVTMENINKIFHK